MKILDFQLGPLETNCYAVVNGTEAVVIDPGGEPAELTAALKAEGARVTGILLTHLHFDHTYGCKALAEATGAPVLACPEDFYLMETEVGRGGIFGLPKVDPFEMGEIKPGEHVFVGETVQALLTPGHTPGSLSYYFPSLKAVFTGDLIFYRSIGRTDFPGGSLEALMTSAKEKIFTLPDDTALYPGHGPSTTVGDEKLHNPYFSAHSF